MSRGARGLAAAALAAVALLGGCHSSLPGGALTGRVIVDGGSAAGLTVDAAGPAAAHTVTDGNGNYRFDGLPFGVYTVSAAVHDTAEGTRSVSGAVSGPLALPDLRFTAVGELRGRATRGGGATGDAGILVTVEGTSALAVTSDDGSYHLTLVPVGTYDVAAQVSGYRAGSASGQVVRWGQVTDVPEIDLTIAPGHATLRGQALLYRQSDHGGTLVTIEGTGLSTVTAADGTWEVDDVPEGTYALDFANGEYVETVPAVEALVGSDGVVIDQSLYALSTSPLTIYPGARIAHITAFDGSDDGKFVISPGGTYLLYRDLVVTPSSQLLALRSVALDGTAAPATLAADWNGQIDPPYSAAMFSPDGMLTAFAEYNALEVAPTGGGTPTTIANGAFNFWWSPDAGGLAYAAPDPTSGIQTLSYTRFGGTSAALVTDKNMEAPAWSHDGKSLLYRTDVSTYYYVGTINRVTLDGSGPVTLAASSPPPLVRADHRWAILCGNSDSDNHVCDVMTVDLDAGTVKTLATGITNYPAPQFAGDRVVYPSGGALFAAALDGSVAPLKLAANFASDNIGSYAVSADGSRVAYTTACDASSGLCQLWTVTSDGSAATQQAATGVSTYQISRDGSHVWFVGANDAQGNVTLQVEAVGQAPRIITSAAMRDIVTGFVPDGSGVIYDSSVSGGQTALAIFRIADGGIVTLGVGAAAPLFSPDAKHVAFTLPAAGGAIGTSLAAVDGSAAPRALLDSSNVAWSPTGVLVGYHGMTSPPYRFQDGFYTFQP
jgi:Tol biopolymer transport system component